MESVKSADENPIGAALRKLREDRGWTLREVEERSGVALQLVSMIERGERPNPTAETLQALAGAFDVVIDEIMGDPPAPSPALRQLLESGLGADITTEEAIRLRRARLLTGGSDLTASEYLVILGLIRARRPVAH